MYCPRMGLACCVFLHSSLWVVVCGRSLCDLVFACVWCFCVFFLFWLECVQPWWHCVSFSLMYILALSLDGGANIHYNRWRMKDQLYVTCYFISLLMCSACFDINISIIRSLRLCCWITTSVVSFCKDGWFSVSVNLRCIVVCVWCDVFCGFVVVGRCILIDIDRYLLCFMIIVFVCVWHFSLVVW